MTWFWFGLVAGLVMTIPVAAMAARHVERRVRRLEQRARSTERLAELGTLTGGLAHEIKNPLSTIGLNVQLIEEDLDALAAVQSDEISAPLALPQDGLARIHRRFESLSRETKRLREILDDFLRFAGRVKLDRVVTDVNVLLDELVDFFEPQAAAVGVQVRTQLAARPARVMADSTMLKQAVLNLMINATEAMRQARSSGSGAPDHGGSDELIIRTNRKRCDGQQTVEVHVTDTGPGLANGSDDRIFQPYFSTKSGGTGLGLPTARRIVEEHGATIHVHSEAGRGCDFVIGLPAEGDGDEVLE